MAATDVTPRCFCGRENIGCLGTSVLSVALQNVLLIGRGWKTGAGPKRYQFLPGAGSSENVWKLTPDCDLFWERRVCHALEISREIRSPPEEQHHSQSGATSSSSQRGSPPEDRAAINSHCPGPHVARYTSEMDPSAVLQTGRSPQTSMTFD